MVANLAHGAPHTTTSRNTAQQAASGILMRAILPPLSKVAPSRCTATCPSGVVAVAQLLSWSCVRCASINQMLTRRPHTQKAQGAPPHFSIMVHVGHPTRQSFARQRWTCCRCTHTPASYTCCSNLVRFATTAKCTGCWRSCSTASRGFKPGLGSHRGRGPGDIHGFHARMEDSTSASELAAPGSWEGSTATAHRARFAMDDVTRYLVNVSWTNHSA